MLALKLDMIKLYSEIGEKDKGSQKKAKGGKPSVQPKTPHSTKKVTAADTTPVMPVPGSASRGKKRKVPSEGGSAVKKEKTKVVSAEPTRAFINTRIAKDFDGDIYFGTITECDSSENSSPLWHVKYEDGDEEDFDRKDLKKVQRLYEKT